MEHQADDDANAEEQKDNEVESDGEESEEDEEEYEVLSLYQISCKKQFYNYKITKLQRQSFLLIILFPKVEEVLERRMAPTKGKKKEWKYLVTWKGLKCFLSFVAFFPAFRLR